MEDWQAKHSGPEMPLRLTTGFLDGTSPVVDIYELKVSICSYLTHQDLDKGDIMSTPSVISEMRVCKQSLF